MKKLLKFAALFFLLALILIAVAIFVLTRPGVQKSLIEKRLPPGSSLGSVQITPSRMNLEELKLLLADGTELTLAAMETDLNPFDTVFNRTIHLGDLQVDGLVVEVPQTLLAPPETSMPPVVTDPAEAPTEPETGTVAAPAEEAPANEGSPFDSIYALGEIDWLFNIDSVVLDGELRDGGGNRFPLQLEAEAIRPGASSQIEITLGLSPGQELPAGVETFDASVQLSLAQRAEGGFEQVDLDAFMEAKDAAGQPLAAITQSLALSIQSSEQQAGLELQLNADLPRPDVILPELAEVGHLVIDAQLQAGLEGETLTLTAGDFEARSGGRSVARVTLNRSFTLGSDTNLSGDLMDLRLIGMPLAWGAPFLPEGVELSGTPLSLALNLTGEADGTLRLSGPAPITMGPLSLRQQGRLLLDAVTLRVDPVLRIASDGGLGWELNGLELTDRGGALLNGQSRGQLSPAEEEDGLLLDGLQTQTNLQADLAALGRQPVLSEAIRGLTGRLGLSLEASGGGAPLRIQGALNRLASRTQPAAAGDYRFAATLGEPETGRLELDLDLEAGDDNQPSTSLRMTGRIEPGSSPTTFEFDLSGPRVTQSDVDHLLSVVGAGGSAPAPSQDPRATTSRRDPVRDADAATGESGVLPPPWAALDGRASISLEEVRLNSGHRITALSGTVLVSEPLLEIQSMEAGLDEGRVRVDGGVRFDQRATAPYRLELTLGFRQMDPASFARGPAAFFPVSGSFDGDFEIEGSGRSLEAALQAAQGKLTVVGRDGVLTAFELDDRSQLGLIGAGLLGQQLNRPGLSAMAQAVPYFQNMPFETFALELERGEDQRIRIPQLQFVGENLLINGTGFIAATDFDDVLNQPLDVTLSFGARGRLVQYLESLGLLSSETTDEGFRLWTQSIDIGGTLGQPNTSALQRLLSEAARRALSRPEAPRPPAREPDSLTPAGEDTTPTPAPRERTREQEIIEDVETGLDILNTLLGG